MGLTKETQKLRRVFYLFRDTLGEEVLEDVISRLPQNQRLELLFSAQPKTDIAKIILGDRAEQYLQTEDETESIKMAIEAIVNFVSEFDIIVDSKYIEEFIEATKYKRARSQKDNDLLYRMNNEVLSILRKLEVGECSEEELAVHKNSISLISNQLKRRLEGRL